LSPKAKLLTGAFLALLIIPCCAENAVGDVTISPTLALSESYDSNVFFRGETGEVEDDFLTTISPQLAMASEGRRSSLSATYRLNSILYHDESSLNYISPQARLAISVDLTDRTTIGIKDAFDYTQDSLEALDTDVQTGRTDIMSNTAGIAMEQALGHSTSLGLNYSNSVVDFDGPGFTDTMRDSAGAELGYSLTEERKLKTNYSYSNFSFDSDGGTTHSESHALRFILSERIRPTIAYNVSAGVVFISDSSDDYDWTASAGLEKSFKNSTLGIGYSRDITHSSGLGEEVSIQDRGHMDLDYSLARSLVFTLSGAVSKNRSKFSEQLELISYSASAGLSWQPYEWMETGIAYHRFQQWDDNSLENDVTRDRVSLIITLKPTTWRL